MTLRRGMVLSPSIFAKDSKLREMKVSGISAQFKWARKILLLALAGGFISSALGQTPSIERDSSDGPEYRNTLLTTSAQPDLAEGSRCHVAGKSQIIIACDYVEAKTPAEEHKAAPRIVLNHAMLKFKTDDENYMRIELTFTNQGAMRVADAQVAYLAIDGDSGQNYLRRVLPHVDFRRLAPGEQLTFSDRLLVAVLQPGHYVIHLWIPSPDPYLKFNPAYNLLLANRGVPNRETGLNTLGTFEILR
jgi:hypothetical protein